MWPFTTKVELSQQEAAAAAEDVRQALLYLEQVQRSTYCIGWGFVIAARAFQPKTQEDLAVVRFIQQVVSLSKPPKAELAQSADGSLNEGENNDGTNGNSTRADSGK